MFLHLLGLGLRPPLVNGTRKRVNPVFPEFGYVFNLWAESKGLPAVSCSSNERSVPIFTEICWEELNHSSLMTSHLWLARGAGVGRGEDGGGTGCEWATAAWVYLSSFAEY